MSASIILSETRIAGIIMSSLLAIPIALACLAALGYVLFRGRRVEIILLLVQAVGIGIVAVSLSRNWFATSPTFLTLLLIFGNAVAAAVRLFRGKSDVVMLDSAYVAACALSAWGFSYGPGYGMHAVLFFSSLLWFLTIIPGAIALSRKQAEPLLFCVAYNGSAFMAFQLFAMIHDLALSI